MSRSRGWCFTINNPKDFDKLKVIELKADYVVCGEELGEKKNTPHLQGYVYFKSAKTMKSVSALLPRARLERAKGTGQQNRDYCLKEGVSLHEKGIMPKDPIKQGEKGREYWDNIKALAVDGRIDEVDSKLFVQNYNSLKSIQKDHMKKFDPLEFTTGEWWYGPSGSGKSRAARDTYPDAYIKGVNKWWDGYRGEPVVIIEDLYKFNVAMGGDLKRWCYH